MFRTVPLSINRSFSLYTQQCVVDITGLLIACCHCTHSNGICHTGLLTACCSQAVSKPVMSTTHCCVYSEKLLMMDRGTVRNMQSFFQK